MTKNWQSRIKLLRLLVEASNKATALGCDGEAVDIRLLIYRLTRKWDDEFEKSDTVREVLGVARPCREGE